MDKLAGNDAEKLVTLAKIAEQAERYEDMAMAMSRLVKESKRGLEEEERNLLSVAFKNVLGGLRSACRIMSSLYEKSKERGEDEKRLNLIQSSLSKIEEELKSKCNEVLGLVDDYLLKTEVEDGTPVPQVFYLKMKGDYYRYLAECAKPEEKPGIVESCKEAYDSALKVSDALPATHPIKLGLALNFSVYYYEIKNDGASACHLAQKAFDDAIAELDSLKEDSYKDSTLIMQLIRDNLTLWTSETDEGNE